MLAFSNLSGKTGAAFDQQFLALNITHHEQDMNETALQSHSATDADPGALATKVLPILRSHLHLSIERQQQLNMDATATATR